MSDPTICPDCKDGAILPYCYTCGTTYLEWHERLRASIGTRAGFLKEIVEVCEKHKLCLTIDPADIFGVAPLTEDRLKRILEA
jgi:hypothetical protein